jgi:hypothetical protein
MSGIRAGRVEEYLSGFLNHAKLIRCAIPFVVGLLMSLKAAGSSGTMQLGPKQYLVLERPACVNFESSSQETFIRFEVFRTNFLEVLCKVLTRSECANIPRSSVTRHFLLRDVSNNAEHCSCKTGYDGCIDWCSNAISREECVPLCRLNCQYRFD